MKQSRSEVKNIVLPVVKEICDSCGKYEGELVADPYAAEIGGVIVLVVLCGRCYAERLADI